MTTNYDLFEKCSNFTFDEKWKSLFDDCAKGKFPKGLKYDAEKNTISIKTRESKKITYVPLSDDPHLVFSTMMDVFRESLGLYSVKDLKEKKNQMDEAKNTNTVNLDCSWKKLKPRYLKERFIVDYIASLQEKYNLNKREVKNLSCLIVIGFQFRSLQAEDVDYSNGKINDIKGLTFDKNKRIFTIPESRSNSNKTEKQVTTNKFYAKMDKVFKEYYKNYKAQIC